MKKNTKRSLFFSVMALILCCALLAGTTLAWFTDTASTAVNKIQAGNLDVAVEYSKTGNEDDWHDIQEANSLFSNNLWEPGHTEFVYLRVKNVGSLGLKYKVLVTPVSENGGINVSGSNFKLSDYLVFGTTEPNTSFAAFTDRAAARAAAGTIMGLNQNGMQQYGEIKASETDEYLALVVYMPESVGNEANAKPGTVAPSIDLGITVVATQLEAEFDSFNDNYDEGAVNDSKYTVGPTYNYFPQVMTSAQIVAGGDTTIEAKGKLNSNDTTDTTLAKVTVPQGAVAEGVTELTVKVVPAEARNTNAQNIIAAEIARGRETANFDIKVDGIADNNSAPISVEVYVGTGLSGVKVYHNGVEISGTGYNPTTGIVTFTTNSFSDFTVAYDAAVAAIGTKTYGSLANAVAAAEDGGTIILLKDSAGNGIGLYANPKGGQTKTKNLIIDFNGFTYTIDGGLQGSTGTVSQAFHLEKDCAVTLKNGTLTSTNAKMLIQNYSDLTLENMNLDGSKLLGQMPYTLSNNNGNVVIKNTTITAASGGVAFDVCRYSSYVGPEVTVAGNSVINGKVEISSGKPMEGAKHKLNVTSGIFNGEIYIDGEAPDFVGNITGGTFSSDPNAFCAKGYGAMKEDGVYKVTKGNFVATTEELSAAIGEGVSNIILRPGDYQLESGVAAGKTVTISGATGAEKVKLDILDHSAGNEMSYQNGATLTFEGVTIQGQTTEKGNYGGIAHTNSVTYKDCIINGKITLYGAKETFESCTFNNSNDYAVWTWGAKEAKFTGCTFNSGGKALLLYGGAGSAEAPTTVLTVTDCVFKDDGTLNEEKAAIEIGNDYGATYHLYINNCTVNGFAVNPKGISTGTTVWANKNSMDKDHLNVVINDVEVY